MKTLTDNQREFLLEKFFKNENYAGWKTIAVKLLETGKCIVAGDRCIWNGGIGNFIQVKNAESSVGCLLYSFDIDAFLNTDYCKTYTKSRIDFLSHKKILLDKELEEISDLPHVIN